MSADGHRHDHDAVAAAADLSLCQVIPNLPGLVYRRSRTQGWRVDFASTGADWLLGVSSAELVAGSVELASLIHPDDRTRAWDAAVERLSTNGTCAIEYRLLRPDGVQRTVWEQSRAIVDGQGNLDAIVAYMTDITELRAVEAQLVESELCFRALYEFSPDAVIYVDHRGIITSTNRQTEQLTGYLKDELVGQPVETLVPSELRARHGMMSRAFADRATPRLMGNGQPELWLQRKDGSRVVVEIGLAPTNSHSGGIVAATIRDVTPRREAELAVRNALREKERLLREVQRRARMLDQARDAVFVWDSARTISFWNDGASRIFGIDNADAIGRPLRDLLPCIEPQLLDEAEAHVAGDGQWQTEVAVEPRPGRRVILDLRFSALTDVDDGLVPSAAGVLAIGTDVTERRQIERQIRRTQRLDSLGMLAGGIAHDLNNMLMPVLTGVELLRGDISAPDQVELLDMIDVGSQRAGNIVRQLLTFAKGGEGTRTVVDSRAVLAEVESMMRSSLPRSVTLVVASDGDVPRIEVDRTQLVQVLVNLSVNARDAMPSGGTLTLELGVSEIDELFARLAPGASPGKYVTFTVHDTGMGITPEVQSRLFEPFFTTKGVEQGTGLGLAMALGIVQSHGGFIQVTSAVGQGTSMCVHLPPCVRTDLAPLPTIATGSPAAGQTILVVEDDRAIRDLLARTLRRAGYAVLTACDGAEGISLIGQHAAQVEVVVTDLRMPEVSGATLARYVRRVAPGLPIVVGAGAVTEVDRAELAAIGVDRVLDKPFTAQRLLDTVHSLIGRRA